MWMYRTALEVIFAFMWRRNEGKTQPKGKQFLSFPSDMPNDEYLPCGYYNCTKQLYQQHESFRERIQAHETWKAE